MVCLYIDYILNTSEAMHHICQQHYVKMVDGSSVCAGCEDSVDIFHKCNRLPGNYDGNVIT